MTHICIGNLTIIGSDNGLPPGRHQAIIWNNAAIFLIGPLGTNFNEIVIEILKFSFKKTLMKVASAKWRPFCLGLNVSSDDTGSIYASMDQAIIASDNGLLPASVLIYCPWDPKDQNHSLMHTWNIIKDKINLMGQSWQIGEPGFLNHLTLKQLGHIFLKLSLF